MEEGRRRKAGCCISRALSQKCLASGITRRHTGVPGQECEAVFSCVPVLISNAPVCAIHSLLAACGSGSDMRDSIFGINSFHTQAKSDHTQNVDSHDWGNRMVKEIVP